MNDKPKEKHPYEDIIHLPHHVSSKRDHMSVANRAAQFSPFAALTGFDGAIKETARLTEEKVDLDETAKTLLDQKLTILQEQLSSHQEIEIVFFQPDEIKAGGAYNSIVGSVKKIDAYERIVVMYNGTKIKIEDIVDITGEMFKTVDDFFL